MIWNIKMLYANMLIYSLSIASELNDIKLLNNIQYLYFLDDE